MVAGNEVSAQLGLHHPRGVLVRGNSKPATTFAEPAISTTGCPPNAFGRIRPLLCVRRRRCKLLASQWLAERFGEIRADFPRCVQRICLI